MTAAAPARAVYLDVWRVIAVFLVICAHLVEHSTAVAALGVPNYGFVGVCIFFFVSGYVVSSSCAAELAGTGGFSAKAFYVRRAFRIVPPLMLYMVVCLLLGSAGLIDFDLSNFLSGLSYACNIDHAPVNCEWYAGHTWSLAFEEQFYLLFPLLLTVFSRRRLSLLLLPALALALLPFVYPVFYIGRTGFVLIHALFGFGALLGLTGRAALLRQSGACGFVLGCALTFFPVMALGGTELNKWYKMVYAVSIPLLVLSAPVAFGPVRAFFASTTLARLGQATYSIYLWQQLILSDWLADLAPASLLLVLALLVGACMLLYELAEKRLIAAGRRISAGITAQAAVLAPGRQGCR